MDAFEDDVDPRCRELVAGLAGFAARRLHPLTALPNSAERRAAAALAAPSREEEDGVVDADSSSSSSSSNSLAAADGGAPLAALERLERLVTDDARCVHKAAVVALCGCFHAVVAAAVRDVALARVVWERVDRIRAAALAAGAAHAPHPAGARFAENVVLAFSSAREGAGDPAAGGAGAGGDAAPAPASAPDREASFDLALVPRDHAVFSPAALRAEGDRVFGSLLDRLAGRVTGGGNPATVLLAAVRCVASIGRARPPLLPRVIPAVLGVAQQPPASVPPDLLPSLSYAVRLALSALLKIRADATVAEHSPAMSAALTALGSRDQSSSLSARLTVRVGLPGTVFGGPAQQLPVHEQQSAPPPLPPQQQQQQQQMQQMQQLQQMQIQQPSPIDQPPPPKRARLLDSPAECLRLVEKLLELGVLSAPVLADLVMGNMALLPDAPPAPPAAVAASAAAGARASGSAAGVPGVDAADADRRLFGAPLVFAPRVPDLAECRVAAPAWFSAAFRRMLTPPPQHVSVAFLAPIVSWIARRLPLAHSLADEFFGFLNADFSHREPIALAWLDREARPLSKGSAEAAPADAGDAVEPSDGAEKTEGVREPTVEADACAEEGEEEMMGGADSGAVKEPKVEADARAEEGKAEMCGADSGARYAEVFFRLLAGRDTRATASLFLDAAVLPDGALDRLWRYVEGAGDPDGGRAHVRLGLTTLRDVVLRRPEYRDGALRLLLLASQLEDDVTRDLAVRLLTNVLFPMSDLREVPAAIARFAEGRLRSLEDATELRGLDEAEIKRRLYLFFALASRNGRMLPRIADTYVALPDDAGGAGQRTRSLMHAQAAPLLRVLGRAHLIALLDGYPYGAEPLVLHVLHAFCAEELGPPPPDVVNAVRRVHSARWRGDARILVPVLAGLRRQEILAALPALVALPPGMTKNALHTLLLGGSAIQPADLLVGLHLVDTPDIRRVAEATGVCLAQQSVYRQEVLAAVLQQLVDRNPVPLLTMRTMIQSLALYPKLANFAVGLLAKLAQKQIWMVPTLWEGFLHCCKLTLPGSGAILSHLPMPWYQELYEALCGGAAQS